MVRAGFFEGASEDEATERFRKKKKKKKREGVEEPMPSFSDSLLRASSFQPHVPDAEPHGGP